MPWVRPALGLFKSSREIKNLAGLKGHIVSKLSKYHLVETNKKFKISEEWKTFSMIDMDTHHAYEAYLDKVSENTIWLCQIIRQKGELCQSWWHH